MPWTRVDGARWELAADGFTGKAVLQETNSGFIANIHVENTDFDMELVDERDFFESRDAAVEFLQRKMQEGDY